MAQAAERHEDLPEIGVASPVEAGQAHGAVGALHQAIEARLLAAESATLLVAPHAQRPVDAALHMLSRAAGWVVLGAGTLATVAAIVKL